MTVNRLVEILQRHQKDGRGNYQVVYHDDSGKHSVIHVLLKDHEINLC